MEIPFGDFYMLACQQYFAADDRKTVSRLVSQLNEKEFLSLQTLEYKSPAVTLSFALSLGWIGADRFYLKDKLEGFIKLTVYLAALIGVLLHAPLVATVALLVVLCLVIADICSAMRRAREYNLELLKNRIGEITEKEEHRESSGL